MSAIEKDPPKTEKPKKKWIAGQTYVCTLSASPGYKKGQTYTCFKDKEGRFNLKGSDGITDLCSMLVSAFEPHDPSKPELDVVG